VEDKEAMVVVRWDVPEIMTRDACFFIGFVVQDIDVKGPFGRKSGFLFQIKSACNGIDVKWINAQELRGYEQSTERLDYQRQVVLGCYGEQRGQIVQAGDGLGGNSIYILQNSLQDVSGFWH
jgi:hypothetical protein